jgi:membrane-bound lytic murein transglycosylase D
MDLGSGTAKTDIFSYEVVEINRSMRLQDIAQKLDASEETLNILNAELRHRITPDRPYKLKIPAEKAELLAQVLSEIPQVDRPHLSFQTVRGAVIKHKVRQGETLDSIAQKYKTSVGEIRSANKQLSKKRLAEGQKLNVPLRTAKMSVPSDKEAKPGKSVRYKVQKGDTLASLSRKHDISITEIRSINDLKNDALKIGQTLRLTAASEEEKRGNQQNQGESRAKKKVAGTGAKPSPGKNPESKETKKQYTVKQGDSLNRIARENNISLEKLLTLNRMAQNDPIRPGQVILVQ